MLRCVLLGEGTAWFDGLAVEDARQSEPEKPDQTPAGAVKDETSPQPRTDPTGAAPSQSSVALEELRTSRQALADANRTLRELNTSLDEEAAAVQRTARTKDNLAAVKVFAGKEKPVFRGFAAEARAF